jgi:hypothetical protein
VSHYNILKQRLESTDEEIKQYDKEHKLPLVTYTSAAFEFSEFGMALSSLAAAILVIVLIIKNN